MATTHKVDLLRNDNIGKDNVTFIELHRKENEGSHLYTLRSFDKVIKDPHRAYLDGRMGAIPYFIDL